MISTINKIIPQSKFAKKVLFCVVFNQGQITGADSANFLGQQDFRYVFYLKWTLETQTEINIEINLQETIPILLICIYLYST